MSTVGDCMQTVAASWRVIQAPKVSNVRSLPICFLGEGISGRQLVMLITYCIALIAFKNVHISCIDIIVVRGHVKVTIIC